MTYEELKKLSDEEKIKVLSELAEKYSRNGKPYFPAIATALKGSVISVADMYEKLFKGSSSEVKMNSGDEKKEEIELTATVDSKPKSKQTPKKTTSAKKNNKKQTTQKENKKSHKKTSNSTEQLSSEKLKGESEKDVTLVDSLTQSETPTNLEINALIKPTSAVEKVTESNNKKGFELTLENIYNGDEAIERISGITHSLYKGAKYSVEVIIKEI